MQTTQANDPPASSETVIPDGQGRPWEQSGSVQVEQANSPADHAVYDPEQATNDGQAESLTEVEIDDFSPVDASETSTQESPKPPPPKPIQRVLWNERFPASAGCWLFWREAGFECRGKLEKGIFTATCKGYGDAKQSQPVEIFLRRRFVTQGEGIAVMGAMVAFDPQQAETLGIDIVGRTMLPVWSAAPVSSAEMPEASADPETALASATLDEEQSALAS